MNGFCNNLIVMPVFIKNMVLDKDNKHKVQTVIINSKREKKKKKNAKNKKQQRKRMII